jgi:uncharacterized repeat protein (TIGR03803 family)
MAPGLSRVIVYEGKTGQEDDVLNRMATDNAAKQLSSSWGFGAQVDATREQIFEQFAAQGQTMFQASGDLGAWVGGVTPPSDDPWLTVVGGTSLTTAGRGGAWVSETVWPESGGGISTAYSIPLWQQGLNMTACQGSTTMRNIPDVACLADATIWAVAYNGEQGASGGTSAAAPLWAGFLALVNQRAEAAGQPSPGFINPAIYAMGQGLAYPTLFHDITSGSNTNSSSPTNFFAVSGYDLCTGWGTPAGSNLISALLAPPDALRITPASTLLFTGPTNGPFTPAGQSCSLTNFGSAALSWSLLNTSAWLSASSSGGALAPGGPAATVTFGLTPAASNLPAGAYAATVWFTNLNDHFAQSREATLAVVTPPQVVTGPANQTLFPGQTAVFSVSTASNALLFYQWRFDNGSFVTNLSDGGNLSGSATSTLTVSNVSSANVGAYFVNVSNAAGTTTSSGAYLALIPWRPLITGEPAGQTALPGQTVSFSVIAEGTQPLAYQWQENGTNLTDAGAVSGSQTTTLTLSNVSAASAGSYSVVVSNALGVLSSTGAVLTVVSVTAPVASLSVVHSFGAGANDGANPNGLWQSADGSFYGTTQHGGTNAAGTVFRLNAQGTTATLYSFTGGNDGNYPASALVQTADGSLYGTTFAGGSNGMGTAFKAATNGALTSLLSFNYDHSNAILPAAGLAQGPDGNFYGTGYEGGSGVPGCVFRLTTNGAQTALYSFTDGSDGGYPWAGLLLGADGNFYGTTHNGGARGYGTVFRISPPGVFTSLAAFNSTNGAFPYAGLAQGDDGTFYGVTPSGGAYGQGVVFAWTAAAGLTNLYSFSGGSDGGWPVGGLLLGGDGNLYGTTANGGAYNQGTVFWMPQHGAPQTLAQFDGYNGANPQAALVQGSDGNVYGTTRNGGAGGMGTAFELGLVSAAPQITSQPSNQVVYTGAGATFSVAVFGSQPLAYQWQLNGTNLADGGSLSGSTNRLLKLSNAGQGDSGYYVVLASNPLGAATSAPAFLEVIMAPAQITVQPTNLTLPPGSSAVFSVSAIGNQPLVYQWMHAGTNLTDGGNVYGSTNSTLTLSDVTEANNGVYAALVSNAVNSVLSTGAVLTVIPPSVPGTRLATLFSFTGGLSQASGLTPASDGNLYGTTAFGGNQPAYGTVFQVTTNGVVAVFARFDTNSGLNPEAGLAQGADGSFYGTTAGGGTNAAGNVFEMTPAGGLTNLYSFTGGSDGSAPATLLTQAPSGWLFGTTATGGTNGVGNVFKISTNGAFANVYSFTGGKDGGTPAGQLTLCLDGNFYGVTTGGGAHNYGTVFRLTPGGALTTLYAFTGGTDGYMPHALAQGTDGNLYGTTAHSTMSGYPFYGTIFKIGTNGSFTTLYSLNYDDGYYPRAGLIQGCDGNFYGTTYMGGTYGDGTVFQITSAGALTTLASFDGFDDGAEPVTPLAQGGDGRLYGTTSSGGAGGHGTVFSLSITSAPEITVSPANQTVAAGASAGFSVAVFGAPPLFYQWQKNGTNLSDEGDISGSAARILLIHPASLADAGSYSVIVSNALGTVASGGATLTVLASPVFQGLTASNAILSLAWSAMTGQTYQLQYKSALTASIWSNLGSAMLATNGTMIQTDAISASAQRYYRVVLKP